MYVCEVVRRLRKSEEVKYEVRSTKKRRTVDAKTKRQTRQGSSGALPELRIEDGRDVLMSISELGGKNVTATEPKQPKPDRSNVTPVNLHRYAGGQIPLSTGRPADGYLGSSALKRALG